MTNSRACQRVLGGGLPPRDLDLPELDEAIANLAGNHGGLILSTEARAFCARLSGRLLTDPRATRFPELIVLGYWLRPSAIGSLARAFVTESGDARRLPRGLALHLPPSNVATAFVYSLALSILAGNRNIVRLSTRSSEQADIAVAFVCESLAECDELARSSLLLTYGHDDDVTARLSARADVRLVWGGDETIAHLRRVPLPPSGRDVLFPDRFSLAALDGCAVAALPARDLGDLARRLYNDIYWFDQLGCASPRMVVWIGEPQACAIAGERLYAAIAEHASQQGYAIAPGLAAAKLAFAQATALDHDVEFVRIHGGRLIVIGLRSFVDFRHERFGAGTLLACRLDRLDDLAPHVRRKDQTLVHFGFARPDLEHLVTVLNGRGLDRLVPAGEALSFDWLWDGMNLMEELTRLVVVRSPAPDTLRPQRQAGT